MAAVRETVICDVNGKDDVERRMVVFEKFYQEKIKIKITQNLKIFLFNNNLKIK